MSKTAFLTLGFAEDHCGTYTTEFSMLRLTFRAALIDPEDRPWGLDGVSIIPEKMHVP